MSLIFFVICVVLCVHDHGIVYACRKLDELEKELSEKHSLVLNKEKQDEQVSIQHHT